jgi:hypothetical protein
MTYFSEGRRQFLSGMVGTGAAMIGGAALAQQRLTEPVYRVAKAQADAAPAGAHPLDSAIELATKGLETIRAEVRDYTCTLVKRERIKGVLQDTSWMLTKIRNRQIVDGKIVKNFAVYLYFSKPADVEGREVLYIENENGGKLIGKEGGLKGKLIPAVWLKPDAPIAMMGNLYPITDIGLENLVVKLIERAQREKKVGDCEVKTLKGAKINERVCTLLQVKHPEKKPDYDFFLAQIFIDDELQLPIRYAAFGWPDAGKQPPVLEEYTYLNLKVNPGLADAEFDPNNPKYKFR